MSDILDSLWKARHPYDVLFLEIIDGYDIVKTDEYDYIRKDNENLLMIDTDIVEINYDKFTIMFNELNLDNLGIILIPLIEKYLNYKCIKSVFFSTLSI